MSGSGVFIWDAEQGIPKREGGVISALQKVPDHDTNTVNYQHFMQVINDFITDAEKQYPDIEYMGHILTNNGVAVEPIPYDILTIFYQVIIETAVNHGLCVYDSLSDNLYTPSDKDDYPVGKAAEAWAAQKAKDELRAALIEQEDYVAPENAKETKQLINKMFRGRLAEEGIKNVKKSSSCSYYSDFGDTQLDILITIDLWGDGAVYVDFYANTLEYISREYFHLYEPSLNFIDVYEVPPDKITGGRWGYQMETTDDFPLFIHQASDMFLDAYPHVQSLSAMYHYFSNTQGETKLSCRFIDDHVCEPIRYKTLVTLAKLTQADYPVLREKYREKWLDWEIKKYYFEKKAYEDREEAIYQRRKGNYKKILWEDTEDAIKGDVEAVITERVDADLADIDGLNVEEILAMDLPRAVRVY